MRYLPILIGIAGLAAGCGQGANEPNDFSATNGQGRAKPSGNATAVQVAKEVRGGLRCPPKVAQAARPAGAPIDDIVGVRPGLSYEDALKLVLCTHDLMVFEPISSPRIRMETYGQKIRQGFDAHFAKERVEKTGEQVLREMRDARAARTSNRMVQEILPGESRWFVGAMGMMGKEIVTEVGREEWFAQGRQPPLASIENALIEKYGTPTKRSGFHGHAQDMQWTFDPQGRQITEGSRLFSHCLGDPKLGGHVNFSPDCGAVIAARIHPLRDNPEIAQSLQITIVNSARGYELISSTEKALLALETARRANQVEEASKNADVPSL